MPNAITKTDYHEAAQSALAMITIACKHKDKAQALDMIGAAAKLFWYAARQSAFTSVRKKGANMMRTTDYPEEVMAIAEAALQNMERLKQSAELCSTLADLLTEEKTNGQA